MGNNVFEQMGAQGVESPVQPQKNDAEKHIVNDSAETVLNIIAWITLACGIIAGLDCFRLLVMGAETSYYSYTESVSVTMFKTLIGSVILWALLRVIANISLYLKDLSSKK